jgi:SAM-dependent methyltransferase
VLSLVRRVVRNVRQHGLAASLVTARDAVADLLFDLRFGVETTLTQRLEPLAIDSVNKERGVGYRPTRVAPLRRLLRTLAIPRESAFIDFGCGKGRVLIVASEYGFLEVIGVEFAPELCDRARRNLDRYRRRRDAATHVEVVEADVVRYAIPDDARVFYFYNPFQRPVLRPVLENIRQSCEAAPRDIWLIFWALGTRRDGWCALVQEHLGPIDVAVHRFGTNDFTVCTTAHYG